MSDRSLRRATRIASIAVIALACYAVPMRIHEIYTCGWECPAHYSKESK